MDFESAHQKLLNHANQTRGLIDAVDEESLLFVLFNADKSKLSPIELLPIRQDIINCLEAVNKKWNGVAPSNTSDGEEEIERYLVFAVSQIIHSCWEYFRQWQESKLFEAEILNQLSFTAWSISSAWAAVLAGDIDSIAEEVELKVWHDKFSNCCRKIAPYRDTIKTSYKVPFSRQLDYEIYDKRCMPTLLPVP